MREAFPLPVSLHDIRLFVAVYEEGSFTAAARREHATQSGVSQHVGKIERELGARLFLREGGKVATTPVGDDYYRRCIDVLSVYEASLVSVKTRKESLDGKVVAGLMPTMTRCALAPGLARFIAAHPNVAVRVVEGYSATLTQQVRAAELDFAIVPDSSGNRGLKSRFFHRTPELLVSRAGGAPATGGPVRLAEIAPLKLVVPSMANTRRRRIETYLASNGVKVERVLELDSMFATLDFVATTDWVAILPGIMMARAVGAGVATRLIVDPPFELDLVLLEAARRAMSPAAEAFLAMLEAEIGAMGAPWEKTPAKGQGPRIQPKTRIRRTTGARQ
ncbi:MAG: LysR family transcriptional regulator [Bauldia sp.]